MGLGVRVGTGIAAGVFCLATVGACTPEPQASAPAAVGAAVQAAQAAPGAEAPAVPGAVSAGVPTSVVRVIDGDTFRTADGLDVRVLGIDSCEAATPGGRRATAAARSLLVGSAVTLTAEPGVDRDRYGRALRYVTVNGRDLSEAMVTADHTAIYTSGRNDASPERQATLRRLDAGGRSCGVAPAPVADRPARPATDVDRPSTRRPVAAVPDRAPARAEAPSRPRTSKPAPAKPAPSKRAAKPAPAKPSASYANCSAARAAGVAPLYRGQPGYAPKLDRDGDGVACE